MIEKKYIPTIDITSLLDNKFKTKKSIKTIKKIEVACTRVGFFQIVGHGIKLKKINKICKVGEDFFKSDKKNKLKLAPKKWNKKNKNVYRGYFPNDVNGKEGLDLGDFRISKKYSEKLKNQYIEYLNIRKSINIKSVKKLSNYFDDAYNISETLFKSIMKLYEKDTDLSNKIFSRLKTLSTLRFNYYPNQSKPVEISKQDGVALGCETHVDSGIFTVLYQNKKGGLQVQNRETRKWHDVPFQKDALIENTGRALEYLSKGCEEATNHRVLRIKIKDLLAFSDLTSPF
jgi:Isopenicillin N synthase and related dioxygenases